MNNNKNDLVGRRYSFHQLFIESNFMIEIPIIQRDYAQGRKNKSEVRQLFLEALYDYLEEDKPDRDLDFVYGSTEFKDGFVKFIPLDGQQRLTTLFLLHWYLATKSGEIKSFKKLMISDDKSRFTYLTRPSSSEFVDALLLNEINLENLEVSSDKENNVLSTTIKDKGWYYFSWNYDPTIQSMLTMLDAIHNKFSEKSYFYERLVNTEKPIITFQYLNLKEFSLTEDLYIKMNSRGKPLTSFENFKAKLEQHIGVLFGEKEQPYQISKNKIKASYRSYFSFQIDTVWANLFWQYKHLVGQPNTFDEEVMNFIRVIMANQFAMENADPLEALKELVSSESVTSEISESISYHRFKSLNALTEAFIKHLIDAFDVLVNEDKKITNHLSNNFYFNENEIFEKALKYSLSLPERALFHAYIRYLIKNKNEKENFFQWMRVIHNLVENSRIEVAEHLISAIKSIEKLLDHSSDILSYFKDGNPNIEFFSSWQVEEEIQKAHLIAKSNSWQTVIEDFEKQSFHKGQLAYLFEFSGVIDFFNKNHNYNWSSEEDNAILNKFKTYAMKSVALFNIFYTDDNAEYLLERALLTKGNYLIPASNDRYNFCSSKDVSNYQRDYSWKRLLRFTTEELEIWETRRSIVKELLDDVNFDTTNLKASLTNICKNETADWRGYFIKNNALIDYCGQGYVKIKSDKEIELYKASQQNHYHIDMYTYNLYLIALKDKMEEYAPFQKTNIVDVKSGEDYSYVELSDWCYKKIYYSIKIYRLDRTFWIEFKNTTEIQNKSEFGDEIKTLLSSKNLEWNHERLVYRISVGNEKSTVNFLQNLCKELNSL